MIKLYAHAHILINLIYQVRIIIYPIRIIIYPIERTELIFKIIIKKIDYILSLSFLHIIYVFIKILFMYNTICIFFCYEKTAMNHQKLCKCFFTQAMQRFYGRCILHIDIWKGMDIYKRWLLPSCTRFHSETLWPHFRWLCIQQSTSTVALAQRYRLKVPNERNSLTRKILMYHNIFARHFVKLVVITSFIYSSSIYICTYILIV